MENEVYGYARVSTKEQNIARQHEQLREFGIPERNIKCDKISGKTFNRMEYNALVGTKETLMQSFRNTFNFHTIRGTSAGVSYNRKTLRPEPQFFFQSWVYLYSK